MQKISFPRTQYTPPHSRYHGHDTSPTPTTRRPCRHRRAGTQNLTPRAGTRRPNPTTSRAPPPAGSRTGRRPHRLRPRRRLRLRPRRRPPAQSVRPSAAVLSRSRRVLPDPCPREETTTLREWRLFFLPTCRPPIISQALHLIPPRSAAAL